MHDCVILHLATIIMWQRDINHDVYTIVAILGSLVPVVTSVPWVPRNRLNT